MILRPFINQALSSSTMPSPLHTTFANIASTVHIRGGALIGAAAPTLGAAFDVGMAKTRLEGLAYGTVTALIIGSSLGLFKCVPDKQKKLYPLPSKDDMKARRSVLLENSIRFMYSICTSLTVALGTYTTLVFTMMSIYSKTALGMGMETKFVEFFDATAKFRLRGFRAFMGTLVTFSIGWILALILCHEGEMKWWVAVPAVLIGIMGFAHYNEIIHLATTLIFS